jgi:hypothetical protein
MGDSEETAGTKRLEPDLVEIEATKFLANFIDRAATALLVGGVISPFFTSAGLELLPNVGNPASTAGVWMFCAIVLHLVGHATLSRLRRQP